ncbi:glycosyltransferase family 4 protein [Hyphomicrobium sp. 2TAF46]|uniref:glycosyltransferase family 4 protein n=1 Tax=Hyphomicrobium sp. 2TAF46 TaxID=3233019 RepID=UPI003F8E6AE9
MPREVVFDLSRLATRFSRSAPNGIDRVDLRYAQHFLSHSRGGRGVLAGPLGPRVVENLSARHLLEDLTAHWREEMSVGAGPPYSEFRRRLAAEGEGKVRTGLDADAKRKPVASVAAFLKSANVFAGGVLSGGSLVNSAPPNAVYLNISQFPLFLGRYFRFLEKRPDIKAVFLVHDILPLIYPEFFPPMEQRVHSARVDVVAKRASGIIVSHAETKDALVDQIKRRGGQVPPIATIPISVDEQFAYSDKRDFNALGRPYFVVLGTVEPRKNHLLLLQVWRELVAERGDYVPQLVIIGANGWENENVRDLLERMSQIAGHVTWLNALRTPELIEILRGARALLMPSFAEGFGLPVSEALTLGVPVVASKLPCFRGLYGPTYLSPDDGLGWKREILRIFDAECSSTERPGTSLDDVRRQWLCRVRDIEDFLSSI